MMQVGRLPTTEEYKSFREEIDKRPLDSGFFIAMGILFQFDDKKTLKYIDYIKCNPIIENSGGHQILYGQLYVPNTTEILLRLENNFALWKKLSKDMTPGQMLQYVVESFYVPVVKMTERGNHVVITVKNRTGKSHALNTPHLDSCINSLFVKTDTYCCTTHDQSGDLTFECKTRYKDDKRLWLKKPAHKVRHLDELGRA